MIHSFLRKTSKLVMVWQSTKLIFLQQNGHCSTPKNVTLNASVKYATWLFSFRGKCFLSISYNSIFFSILSVQLEKKPEQNQNCIKKKKIWNLLFYRFSAFMMSSSLKSCLDLNTYKHLAFLEEWYILGHCSYSTQSSQLQQEM